MSLSLFGRPVGPAWQGEPMLPFRFRGPFLLRLQGPHCLRGNLRVLEEQRGNRLVLEPGCLGSSPALPLNCVTLGK